jgi:hypothetical protein
VIQVSNPTRPVTGTLGPAHRCPRCSALKPVKPLTSINSGAEIRYIYECPRCRHSWWNTYNTSADEPWGVAA